MKKTLPNYIILGINLNNHSSIYNLSKFMSVKLLLSLWLIYGVIQLQLNQVQLHLKDKTHTYKFYEEPYHKCCHFQVLFSSGSSIPKLASPII
jgi:hypothetical protein